MQTLFIYNKPVIISQDNEKTKEGFITMENPSETIIASILQELQKEHIKGLYLKTKDSDSTFHALLKHFQHWQAAGGLIFNPAGEILLMFRKGKWDLPKGKMEIDENPKETALREVTEETGLKKIKIIKKLTDTWHSYPVSVYDDQKLEGQKDIIKQTHWFQMEFTGDELTIPQIEEDIIDIQWIKPKNIGHYIKYSYPNLKLVFETVGYRL